MGALLRAVPFALMRARAFDTRRASLTLGFLVLHAGLVGAAGLGVAAESSPNTTRFLSWMLGSRVSLAALAYSQGAPEQLAKEMLAQVQPAAEALGTWIPPFPARTGDSARDTAAILRYLLDNPMIKELNLRYPADHVALFEVSVKSNLLQLIYVPGDDLGVSLATAVSQRSATARLPEALWNPVVNAVSQRASSAIVTAAVRSMHSDVASYLEQRL